MTATCGMWHKLIYFKENEHKVKNSLVQDLDWHNVCLFHEAKEIIDIMLVMRKWKLQWWSGSKNSHQNFMRQGYMLSCEGGSLLVRKIVTMSRSREVIHRGSASFCCMIHVPVTVIIPVLKKKILFLYIYIYIYSKVDDGSWGWSEGSLFKSYYTEE